jgi:hypothetical protein
MIHPDAYTFARETPAGLLAANDAIALLGLEGARRLARACARGGFDLELAIACAVRLARTKTVVLAAHEASRNGD